MPSPVLCLERSLLNQSKCDFIDYNSCHMVGLITMTDSERSTNLQSGCPGYNSAVPSPF